LQFAAQPEPKHATIIGAGGFIGTALHARLQALGWSCTLPDRSASWSPTGPLGHVFYCAGLTADYALRPVDTVEAHVGLLSRVLASPHWLSLVYLSSTRVYDGQPPQRYDDEEGPFVTDPCNARHLYDLSKLLGENLCHVMGKGKARVARLSCVYRDERDPDGFMGHLMRNVLTTPAGTILSVDSSPDFQRDYVHLDDVVEALLSIALAGRSRVYNVASGINVTNSELAEAVWRSTGVRIKFTRSDIPTPGPVAQRKRLTGEFGWQPRELIQAVCAWALSHGRTGKVLV
jgi:nucleoside-diphosphate-sugar epimerase